MSNIIEINTATETTEMAVIGKATVANVLTAIKDLPVINEKDMNFLQENKEHLGKVMENTYIWRTDLQKVSILNDIDFPTDHSKFHQAILEQKVQFDNAMFLAKDYEDLKLDMEILECEIEELEDENIMLLSKEDITNKDRILIKKNNININKKTLDIQFKRYNIEQMRIAMDYRMKEVKGWMIIEDEIMKKLSDAGMTDQEIWDKSTDELEGTFFSVMKKLQAIGHSSNISTAEYNNMVALGVHVYNQAVLTGQLHTFLAKAERAGDGDIINSTEYIANVIKSRQ